MSKYQTLLNILDKIRDESIETKFKQKYQPDKADIEKVNQARSRAFIHLYLLVSHGILDFTEREHFITDGTQDGGIDGYYIDTDKKVISLIQSKFRTSQSNFEQKHITLEELLSMDVDRILNGETTDEKGNDYSGKVLQLVREIGKIEDVARYKYQVILIANVDKGLKLVANKLFGKLPVIIFDFDKCYQRLVFPVISGTFFNASDLSIQIDLSNKNAGSKISYPVNTSLGEAEITVLFVPTIEIAKILTKYKNSILKFNPRSYLELEGKKVNIAIRDTIVSQETNEFALFNNGITFVSNETSINERIGQKSKAKLMLKNPQIINGGQTAYTLSKLLQENDYSKAEKIFENKEVLVKIITLNNPLGSEFENSAVQLIDKISTATNQQTTVSSADRRSNEKKIIELQRVIYDRFGLLFERKRGEFGDGISNGYIADEQVIERNLLVRLYYASLGRISNCTGKRPFLRFDDVEQLVGDLDSLDRIYFGYLCLLGMTNTVSIHRKRGTFVKLLFLIEKYKPHNISEYKEVASSAVKALTHDWEAFISFGERKNPNLISTFIDRQSGETITHFNVGGWMVSSHLMDDIRAYVSQEKNEA
ncbi:hypothetical protein AZI86_00470 [Bdellovibrio bacteriovorus]|uniref:Abortive phage infection protein C-terminal domain-containing protein n=1 Tax=Bdellovibrio bacteriovorus TaxID=959 RepID=A0A150WMG9_BDEBC|nr:AIPR family protein [Bdellovibrio bacteriovorus]KYG65588.1 hypothetical protein AZI86_00470 [Bdellovibrio bacteriovorus]